jgi:ABC transporter related protein
MENIITGTNIGKTFDENVEVLKNVNFNIEKGDIYGLVGRSGAGKSTLLRCINGLISYDTGSLKVYDKEINLFSEKELREFRKKIGMIFQHFSLIERRSVYHNIAIPMECWGYKEKEIRERVMNLLNLVGLEEKSDVRPRQLSGGQK